MSGCCSSAVAARPASDQEVLLNRRSIVVPALALALGGGAIGLGLRPAEPPAAPLPERTFHVDAAQARSGAAGRPADRTGPAGVPSAGQDAGRPGGEVDAAPDVDPAVEAARLVAAERRPDRLLVPSLGIDARLVAESLDPDGALDVPGDPATVGRWSDGAPVQADSGTTLLAGHVDSDGRRGALYDLHDVRPGALVLTTDARGHARAWAVTGLDARAKEHLPTFTATGPRRLVLVTCGGPVLHTSRGNTYRDNVIVEAVPVP